MHQIKERVHRAAWDLDFDTTKSSESDTETEDCNMAFMASIDTETKKDEVILDILSKTKLIDLLESTYKGLSTCKLKSKMLYQRVQRTYNTIDELTNKEILEEKSKTTSNQVSSLKEQNSKLIEKLQHLTSQPLISLNHDELKALQLEKDNLQNLNQALREEVELGRKRVKETTKLLNDVQGENQKLNATLDKFTHSGKTLNQLLHTTFRHQGRKDLK